MPVTTKLDAAIAYAERGYYILPCHWITNDGGCSCNASECNSPGKHPFEVFAPRGSESATNDRARIAAIWSQQPDLNIGLNPKKSGLVVIDVDPRNGGDVTFDELEATHGKIESNAEQLTGGGGQHFVFRALPNDHFPGALGRGIDIKHNGFIIVYPSNHASGRTYEWEASADLLELIEPVTLRPDWLANAQQNSIASPSAEAANWDALYEEDKLELVDLLNRLPADSLSYSDWFEVAVCIYRSYDSGKHGFDAWREWSAKDAERYSENQRGELEKKWRSIARYSGTPATRGTLLHMVAEYEKGIRPGSEKPISEVRQEAAEQIAAIIETAREAIRHDVAVKAEITQEPYQSTDEDTIPALPNMELAQLADMINNSSLVANKTASVTAALMLAAVVTSRRYIDENGQHTHFYTCVMAESTVISTGIINALTAILDTCKAPRLLSSSRFTTINGIYGRLIDTPAFLHVVPDFGKLLQQSKKQFANGSLEHMVDMMALLHGLDAITLNADEFGKKIKDLGPNAMINNPAMSLMGFAYRDQISHFTRQSEIGSGLMANTLLIQCEQSASTRNRSATPIKVPSHIADKIAVLQTDKPGQLPMQISTLIPRRTVIKNQATVSFDDELFNLSSRDQFQPVLEGARVTMYRLANAIAAFESPEQPVIDNRIMTFAGRFVLYHTRRFLSEFSLLESQDGKLSLYQVVSKAIWDMKKAGLNKEELRNKCYAYRLASLENRQKTLDALIEDAAIVYIKLKTTGKYRFIASAFLDGLAYDICNHLVKK